MNSEKERPNDELPAERSYISGAVTAALFIGLITVGSYVVIPLPFSPVPIALQSGFVILTGLLLAPRWAAATVATYLIIGALGLPVFAGGTGGLGHLIGPTGGYLVGYLPAALITSLLRRNDSFFRLGLAAIAGSVVIYICGVPWLAQVQSISLEQALSVGMIPFLPGDAIKAVAAVLVARHAKGLLPSPMRAS